MRLRILLCLGLLLALGVLSQAVGQVPEGIYKLTYANVPPNSELTAALLKIENKDGKVSGSLIAEDAALRGGTLQSVNVEDGLIRVVFRVKKVEWTFEGRLPEQQGQPIQGSFSNDKQFFAAALASATASRPLLAGVGDSLIGKLDRETLKKHAGTPLALQAALDLLRDNANADEAKNWAATAAEIARTHGPRMQVHVNKQIASALMQNKALIAEAKRYAEDAELILDKDYHATVPPFKPTKFSGRKEQSDRVVVMELFTGAQCPPCVASDVAFDALETTYNTSEVALIQYHLHIPGPDPMTNADTEARAKYYGANSTPSTFFNGKREASGGGAMSASQKKYLAYRKVIEPLLEKPAGAKVKAVATRRGDRIDITVNVSDVAKASDEVRVRLVLAEENIRYVGSNKIRFHHHVVRALPGGVQGMALTGANSELKANVDISELREKVVRYLDNYAATKRAFPYPHRPLDMDHLIVFALVQDDATKEILQATQVHVTKGTE